ncbi:MAG: hypothetical protein Fur0032_15660 [Terrimicrobiaceae bacterium]
MEGVDLADPARRAAVVERIAAEEEARRRAAVAKATAMGLPLRTVDAAGRVSELRDFRGDRPLYLQTSNRNAAISSAANLVAAAPYSLNGSGMRVGVWDEGSIRSTHQELTGRVTLRNPSAQLSDHATHVGGTVAASGVQAQAIGMAPQASIDSYDWNSDTSEMTAAGAATATEAGKIPLSNHSYGFNAVTADMGRYDTETRSVDSLAASLPYYLIFWAAGNEQTDLPALGGYQSITFIGLAKNVMTVGAVNDAVSGGVRSTPAATMSNFSSWGPCDDGRIKPDVVANGVSVYSSTRGSNTSYASYDGTSMATPSAMGSATLLAQLYQREFSGQRIRASMLKALMIHTADDLGPAGPDYRFGWGLINTKAAADVILQHKASLGSPKLIEDSLTNAQKTRTHTFTWDGVSPIRATLAWTDPAGAAQTAADSRTPNLVHNLDLRITSPNGTTVTQPFVMPFVGTWTRSSMAMAAIRGKNNVDNVEQVLLTSPGQAGTYTVTVSLDGTLTTSSQAYSLVLTGGVSSGGSTRSISLEGDLAYGSVTVGSTAQRTLTVRNLGTASLTVQSITLPAGFTATPTNFAVPAGGQQAVTVTFAPTAVQNYAGSLVVTSDATTGSNTVAVSGSGIAAATIQPLTNGSPVPNLSGSTGSELFFRITVPAGQQQLTFSISGGTGDADLYVRRGSVPTTSLWDFRPYLPGNAETVTISNPQAGDWFVMVRAYSTYSGTTLTASHQSTQVPTRILRLSGDLDFGFVPVGGSVQATLTIFNDGNANLGVSGISVPAGFIVNPATGTIPPGGSQAVTVTFSPTQVAVYSGVLTVQSDKTSGEETIGLTASGVDSVTPLTNGVPTPPFNGLPGFGQLFRITVPTGQSQLEIRTSGGTGDAGLFVRRGQAPTTTVFDQSSRSTGNNETITIPTPTAGDYFILVAADPEFSAVSLVASFSAAVSKVIRLEGNLAFGNVRVGESAQRTIQIFNDGSSPLTVTGVTVPNGFSVTGAAGVIQPRTSRTATVTFTPGAAGSFGGNLSVQSDKTSGTETLACSGTGVPADDVTRLTNGVAVSSLSGSRGSQLFFVISVPSGVPLLEISTSGGSGDADLYVRAGAKPTRSLYDERPYLDGNDEKVTINNPPAGDYYIMIDGYSAYTGVSLLAAHGGSAGTRIIGLSGNLSFGEVTVGSSLARTLTISNTGNDALTVSGITYPPGFTGNWSGGSIAAGASRDVQVTFSPVVAGSFGGTISVASNSTSGSGQIACSGTGRPSSAPVAGLTGNLHFGDLTVGTTAVRTLTISNTGNADLLVTNVTFPAGFTGNWTGGTIFPGSSRNVSVTFAPTAAVNYGGTVAVASNSVGGSSETSCSGRGIASGDGDTLLSSGILLAGIGGSLDSRTYFAVDVPEGASRLTITTSGGSGDADLYVRRGARPTLSTYDARPFLEGNNETVVINNPAVDRYYVMLHAYRAFSSVSLLATVESAGGSIPPDWLAWIDGGEFYGMAGGLTIEDADPSNPLSGHGMVRINTAAIGSGLVTGGSIQIGRTRYNIAPVAFDATTEGLVSGNASMPGRPQAVSFQLQFATDSGGAGFAGTLSLPDGSSLPVALRARAHSGRGSDISPLSGHRFNTVIEITSGDPTGLGYASVRVLPNGDATIEGRLPDHSAFRARAPGVLSTSGNHQWSAVVPLKAGAALWALTLEAVSGDELGGQALHIVGDGADSAGSANTAVISGLRWIRPAGALITPDNFLLTIDPNGFSSGGPVSYPGSWGLNKPVLTPRPAGTTLKFAPSTGVFSGRALPLDATKPTAFRGLVLPETVTSSGGLDFLGAGYLIHSGISLPVLIQPTAPSVTNLSEP